MLSDDDVEVEEIADGYYRYTYNGKEMTSLELLIKGLFKKEYLLEFINDFVFYEKDGETYKKKIAGYHQFYTVKKAIQRTFNCVLYGKIPEDRRIGVVWHTQGSGKSLTMLFYAKKALKVKELENPLLLFITDRKDLDEQLYKLFSQFSNAKQAESIKDLQETIKTTEGSIIFATIQKFGKRKAEEYPFLTERKNIVVIADEAHRSQYRELAQNLRKAIPNASFMGFTATPIELQDRDTYLVFGEPISVYPMDKALRHKIIVPIYYEPRLAELHLTNEFIDEEFEELSEGLEPELKEHLKKKYARLEELILNQERLEKIAKDIVEHFNKRFETLEGKGMIVVISRKVAVELYKAIKRIPDAPSIEVVMSGNKQKDPEEYHPFIRNKERLEDLLNDFKNPEKDPKMVIVVDMLLTGFDVPCLHTMYFDKPMKNHSLIQAIARVNRVFKDKPAGLIVDYIGIADDLRKSLSQYTLSAINQVLTNINEVINVLKEKYDIVSSMFYGLNYQNWKKLTPEELAQLTVSAYNLLNSEDLKKKFIKNYLALKKAYALASPHPETIKIKDDIMFFEMIKKMIVKYSSTSRKEISRELEYEISQLISRSISAEEPVDIFSLIKKEKPDISILNEELLSKIANLVQKNYAVDLLMKLIKDEIKTRIRINPYRYKSLYERLQKLIEKYNIKLISTVDVINELIEIAKEIKKKLNEGKELDLTEEELAFYDMLLKEGVFRNKEEIIYVVKEIKKQLGHFVKIVDWNKKETLRARIKVAIKEILAKVLEKRVGYEKINKITSEIYEHIEMLHAA
jgi:type I restriction enzyme R subunit